MVEGEKTQRVYRSGYPKYAKEHRPGPVNFSVIPQLRLLIEPEIRGELPHYPELVLDHLDDAANEQLPVDVREQHFDIAGAIVWDCMFPRGFDESGARYMKLFVEANGI